MRSTVILIGLIIAPTPGISQMLTTAEVQKRIEKATPPLLPQEPRVARPTTDVQDDRLKGKVRVMTDAVIASDGSTRKRWESYYDASGYLTKTIFYDYSGNPSQVQVFGYIDGKRVSKTSASITYGYDPPPIVIPPGEAVTRSEPPVDNRYDSSFTYKYDALNRLAERAGYSSNSTLGGRTVYTYSGDTVETLSYNASGDQTDRKVEKFDSKGDVIEMSFPEPRGMHSNSIYRYKYEAFDPAGNWLRATVTGKLGLYGGAQKDLQYTEVRTITYF
jgi:hypothetical protein